MQIKKPKKQKEPSRWRFAIDRGGTFTDIIGIAPDGGLRVAKLLSESEFYDDSGIEGIRRILSLQPKSPLPSGQIEFIRMGTTVATNALLERKGSPTGLLITDGFRDLLEIGTQDRPDLFALAIKKPEVIYKAVREVPERIGAKGEIITPLDRERLHTALQELKDEGVESLAIVFLFSWKNPSHEIIARDEAIKMGFSHVVTSHETMPVIKAVGRGRTTLVDAYLTPVLKKYADSIRALSGSIPLYFMSSSGSIVTSEHFTGKDAILSGPAGGVLGVETIAKISGEDAVIGFDMGGTSTDVSRWSGTLERTLDAETGGVKFTAPMLAVKTVAAGGGSILGFDGRKLTVGPESSGANPGPACYGRGGPASLTDANLILGRLHPKFFPRVFGQDQKTSLDISQSKLRFLEIADRIEASQNIKLSVEELALGFIRIANENMSRPIKELSIARGHDPRTHALIVFGGAGAQHACGIARALGIKNIIVPPLASLLSAFGILTAPLRRTKIETFLSELTGVSHERSDIRARQIIRELETTIRVEANIPPDIKLENKIELDLRTPGTDTTLTLPINQSLALLKSSFLDAHLREYGFSPTSESIEIVNIRVEVSEKKKAIESVIGKQSDKRSAQRNISIDWADVFFNADKPLKTPIFKRDDIVMGEVIPGPALIVELHSTIVLEPGFDLILEQTGNIRIMLRSETVEKAVAEYDPILLEVFHNLFMGVAEQMGKLLERTAHSVNIKERLDFSCAVFDGDGRLVANANHIPVHLGAMGETVRNMIESVGSSMQPGDFYLSNDPYSGGSHLPDITVVAPIMRLGKPIFFLASRGHHADIGGVSPGSMYPFAKSLDEEGVVLTNFLVVHNGRFLETDISKALTSSQYPARNLPERLADIRAQIAAVHRGITEIEKLCEKYGEDVVRAYMKHIRDDARCAMTDKLSELLGDENSKSYEFTDYLDCGAAIKVKIRIFRDDILRPRALIDFTGTDRELDSSLNAPPAVTKAAVLYVFRTLINRPIPLNDGCLEPIEIIIPENSLLNPSPGHAVCGGNVETSQRIVDVLYGALGVAAASQGTMNNISFGTLDGGYQYYETIAGGSGAVEGHDGASAVQVHMTNTRITDPEVIETRFPSVRLEKFLIRKESGGNGKWRGGDGVIRAYKFLAPHQVSILSERRIHAPFGLKGGNPGSRGENRIISKDGIIKKIDGHFHGEIGMDEILEIRTPGAGGWGEEMCRGLGQFR